MVSTVEPQSSNLTPFYTSDGYQWIRIYRLDQDQIINYSTDNLIPIIIPDTQTGDGFGKIYSVIIDSAGTNYTNSPAGVPNQVPFYYANIIGDGVPSAMWLDDDGCGMHSLDHGAPTPALTALASLDRGIR